MKTVIIDYGSGNVESVSNALHLIKENHEIIISKDLNDIRSADHLILPGVGSFADCMEGLKATKGLIDEIKNQVLVHQKPFLGVCVGMQVLASLGHEDGTCEGLDLIKGEVKKIIATDSLKVPHMGWNDLIVKPSTCEVFKNLTTGDHFYFANSYHFQCANDNNVVAYAQYGTDIATIVAKDNIIGLQFHPEKSGENGLQILKNFLNWKY